MSSFHRRNKTTILITRDARKLAPVKSPVENSGFITSPHSMRCRVYGTVGCPSVRPSVPSIDSSSGVRWFAAELGHGQQMSIDSYRRCVPATARYLLLAPELRLRVASCREPRYEAQHRLARYSMLNTSEFVSVVAS